MIAIDKIIVTQDVFTQKFVCDLNACKGECCISGVSGAPLDEAEVPILEKILPKVKPYMTKQGIKAVEEQGVFVIDDDRDVTTPLINGGECAFVYKEKGIALCAIEKAYKEGKIKYKKPISCHLYPIRINKVRGVEKLEYHRWNICKPACKCGTSLNVAVYKFLKDPLVRKYGADWYKKLELAADYVKEKK